jgi:hypothetical protein
MISIHNISNKTGCAGIPVVAAFQYTPNIIETLKYNGLPFFEIQCAPITSTSKGVKHTKQTRNKVEKDNEYTYTL